MKLSALSALSLCFSALLSATPVTYSVSVNTASLNGTSGSLDFNFNPGPFTTQAATLEIQSFSSTGTLEGGAETIGDVTGTLPASVNFDNGTAFNDYFAPLTYGSALTFDVSFSGPALNAPDGLSNSGSTFAFSMFSDAAGTVPALTSDTSDGYALLIDVNLDGSTTVTNYSTVTTILGSSAPEPPGTVPEPSTLALLGLGGIAAAICRRRQAQGVFMITRRWSRRTM